VEDKNKTKCQPKCYKLDRINGYCERYNVQLVGKVRTGLIAASFEKCEACLEKSLIG